MGLIRSDLMIFISSSFLLISLSSIALADTNNLHPLIKDICDKTTNPGVCSTSIQPYQNGKTDADAVFRMQATAAMHAIEDGAALAKKLAAEKTDKAAAERLKGCADSYKSALDDYKDALKALDDKDPGNLGVQLSAVVAMLSTCDDSITEDESMPESTNPMTNVNLAVNKMNDNCFDMRHIIFPKVQDP